MDSLEDEFVKRLESYYIPVYPSSERAVKALATLYEYKLMRSRRMSNELTSYNL